MNETVEAETIVLNDKSETRGLSRRIWKRETTVFIATLVVTFVVGYAPDLRGIFDWFATLAPLAGALSPCKGNS